MTYDQYMDDPFGKKKAQIKDFQKNQKNQKNIKDDQGQVKQQHLSDRPQQPKKLMKRQLNSIHITNKSHFDQKPIEINDNTDVDDFVEIRRLARQKEHQEKLL